MGNGQPAIDQMREWLMEIYAAKDELLNRDDLLERTVRDMLTPQPSKRITMAAVAQALAGEALVH
jgi:hypothetical protein